MKKITGVLSLVMLVFNFSLAQTFSHADTLRGSNGPGRAWWNATKYDLHVNFNIEDSSISGYNIISFKELNPDHVGFFQIDLQEPLIIDSVILDFRDENRIDISAAAMKNTARKKLDFIRDGNAWFVFLKENKTMISNVKPQISKLIVYYHGKPKVAKNAPWDGGVIWKKDKAGNPWIAVACQGLGASVWYPCKDYQGDEPDSANMHFTTPSNLVSVSNGRLKSIKDNGDGKSTYTWTLVSSVNNYNISPYIGKYVHFGEIYKGEKGNLTMDYWVLDSNLTKAKEQFKDAPRMMKAFEYWFGPYPFYEDGYKLVDAPYLGMEHQSAVAYGNGYRNGYFGKDLSGSGQGMKWDFIIVHESGHEWFGNNITAKDIADMWIHEGFTNYSETLFTEYYYGKKAATEYIVGIRKKIQNDKPIVGHYGVNNEGSGDMYYKAGNMLHTIRQVINNDEKFRGILRGLNKTFYHQTVATKEIED
ncbi:MAG TPA: M1 family metallopeptidase, partial [Hanamia sp.]|nr:M1 family metallopeptidase [Hanamia sp.]